MKVLADQLAEALEELRAALVAFTAGPYLRPGETDRVHQAFDKATTALADHRAAATEQLESEAVLVCYEAYQVVGSMLNDLGQFNTERATKILDNLSQARKVHHDVLPWPSFERPARDPVPLTDDRIDAIADLVVRGMPEGLRGFLKIWGWQQFARALLQDCAGHDSAASGGLETSGD